MNFRPTVLVVEDEVLMRMDIMQCLEEAGCEVLEVADAVQAIAVLENRRDIHLVFTDIDMPGSMDGLKLAAFVRDRWPPIQIIVASGHVTVDQSQLPSGGRFFSKPYDGSAIAHAVKEMVMANLSRG